MEPQIQYVTTSDGVNIAYYAIGQVVSDEPVTNRSSDVAANAAGS